jgi:hypothetical protein
MQKNASTPDPEVPAKATRRRFSTAEKARILDAYEAASDIEKAAICRRERVYAKSKRPMRPTPSEGLTARCYHRAKFAAIKPARAGKSSAALRRVR